MGGYILSLIMIGFLVFVNYRMNRSMGYPPFLYSLVWFVVIFIHFICIFFKIFPLYALSFTALAVFTSGVFLYTLGGALVVKKSIIKDIDKSFAVKSNIDKVLIFLSFVFLIYNGFESYKLAQEYMIFDSLFAGLRNASVQEADVGFSKYGIIIAYFSFFIQIYKYIDSKINRKSLLVSGLILLLFCILSTGRSFFVIFFMLIIGVLIVYKKLKKAYIVYAVLLFLLLFSIIGIFLNKGGSVDNSLGENINSIFESFLIYFVGGLSAFDYFLHSNYESTYGEISFRFFHSMLGKLGYSNVSTISLVDGYVSIPFDTNVYTIYKVYFQDFGYLYMCIMMIITSFIHSHFYYRALSTRKFGDTFIYSIMLYPLIMSFFQEQYITLLPTWIYMMIVFFLIKPFIVEKNRNTT